MTPRADRRRLPAWLVFAGLLPPLAYLAVEVYLLDGGLGFPLDDSWIHLQFARNLAAGLGLSYNPGELVPGSTAPLWTALLSLVFLLPLSPLLGAKLLALAAHVGALAASWRLARALGVGRELAAVATLVVATTGWLAWSAMAAMEVPLFLLLSLEGMTAHLRERRRPGPPVACALLGLAALARPEGLLLLALAVADRLVRVTRVDGAWSLASPDRTRVAAGLGVAAVALVPTMAVYTVLGGSPVPTTFSTKAGYAAPGLPRLGTLDVIWGIFFQSQPLPTLLAIGGGLALLARWGGRRDAGLLPALWAAGLPLAYAVLSAHASRPIVGNFGRYFFPLFPVVIVLAAVAAHELGQSLPRRLRLGRFGVAWPLWVGIPLLAPGVVAFALVAGRYGQSVLNVEDSDVRASRLLAPVLPPEAVLAVNDIGAVGYLLPNRLVDLAGIVTPEVHAWAREAQQATGDYRPGLLAYVEQVRPDYLLVFPGWFGPALAHGPYRPLLRIEIPDNITMGGDELVLYATPWNRFPLRSQPTVPDSAPPRAAVEGAP